MAHIQCDFFSETLQLWVSVNVILSERNLEHIRTHGRDERYPVLYLLHGLSDDHTAWQRRTSIEQYVDPLGLAVIMPAVHRSFYSDMTDGLKYWTFVSEELPVKMNAMFPLSDQREDTFAAGLSMGGYGAFKLALSYPERFAAAASLSGALDMRQRVTDRDPGWQIEIRRMFGDPAGFPGSPNDLLSLAEKVAQSAGPKPMLYHWCGTEDFLVEQNKSFEAHARQIGLSLESEYAPGDHTWKYWDLMIQRVLAWLPIKNRWTVENAG